MNINYCFNCPYFEIYSYGNGRGEDAYSGACGPSGFDEVSKIFIIKEKDVDFIGIHKHCPSKLEHLVLEDDTAEFSKNNVQVIQDTIKLWESKNPNSVKSYTEMIKEELYLNEY